ncbi:hypothetical protein KDC22_16090 [Paenibacillus tritici]|uniref:hypothetical protein n=1 Tax=Paenibacillus tritici TaxID=1873425 RepID=UPI001BA5DAEB|nr:hypothetical protein [Paenibacillus tritici]QUL57860.1 hypothetical protein KDC22_16090 [Paenibacillus tritici]
MHEGKHEPGGHRGARETGHPFHEEGKRGFRSAQTFRRGRALAFLERLYVKRSTLLQQLNQPEFQEIRQIISGELKATDGIIQEFIQAFELREVLAEQELTIEGAIPDHDNP